MFKEMRRQDKLLSKEKTLSLLRLGEVGTLSTIGENGYPYMVVVNYVFYNDKIYIHSAKEGYKLENIQNKESVCFSVYDNVKIIGEDLNTIYESLIVFGKAKVIDGDYQVLLALIKKYSNIDDLIAMSLIEKEIHLTSLIEIEIEYISGKQGK